MRFCPKCGKSPLPLFMALFIAGVSAYMTWLTLTYSQAGTNVRILGTVVVFVAVGGTVMHYMISCLRRHCRHRDGAH
jgi:hypothetical protein